MALPASAMRDPSKANESPPVPLGTDKAVQAGTMPALMAAPIKIASLDVAHINPVAAFSEAASAYPMPIAATDERATAAGDTPKAAQPVSAAAKVLPRRFLNGLIAANPVASLPPTRLAYAALPDVTLKSDTAPAVAAPIESAPSSYAYLADYAYSEAPPPEKPADTVLRALKDTPEATPAEEVRRAALAFGLDVTFMETVVKIESDFDPKQRTGSYIGLFQLSKYEFDQYGSGEITDARDNAIAGAYKFAVAAILFEIATHQKATPAYLYLIHQQGTQGAAEHVAHPERLAWQSMCATDEGRVKGESWCKRAIWGNTLPDVKKAWGSVEKLTSAAFVAMWSDRVAALYQRYAASTAAAALH